MPARPPGASIWSVRSSGCSRTPMLRRALVAAAIVAGVVVATPALASAHPLGNFTVNTYAGVRVGPEHVAVDYVVDMAEIPTLQRKPDIDRDGNGTVSGAEGGR